MSQCFWRKHLEGLAERADLCWPPSAASQGKVRARVRELLPRLNNFRPGLMLLQIRWMMSPRTPATPPVGSAGYADPMRTLAIALLAAALLLAATPAATADMYRVYVRRIGQDLYQDTSSGVVIQTQFCYHYCYGEEAILIWEGPYSYNNKLIFEDGSSYRVVRIMR